MSWNLYYKKTTNRKIYPNGVIEEQITETQISAAPVVMIAVAVGVAATLPASVTSGAIATGLHAVAGLLPGTMSS